MDFLKFLQYHNAVPIAVSVMLLGAGGAFAASNPEAIFSEKQTILSVDNTYIANKDLSVYTPRAQINAVTEDADTYYVAYTLDTIDLENYVWRDTNKKETMSVSKESLGQYGDLGLFVTEQLKQIINRELERLKTTQEIERKNVTQKTVAIAYGGLIGALLDSTTEEIPGYVPVVTPPPPPPESLVQQQETPQTQIGSSEASPPVPSAENPAGLQVLGNNPAQLNLRDAYVDLGVAITNIEYANFGVHVQVDNVPHEQVAIDTTIAGAHTIRYTLTDGDGVTSVVERQVVVGSPDIGGHESDFQVATTALENSSSTDANITQ